MNILRNGLGRADRASYMVAVKHGVRASCKIYSFTSLVGTVCHVLKDVLFLDFQEFPLCDNLA